jgi:hypothetical protein
VLKPDVGAGNVHQAPHHRAQLLRGEFNNPNQMRDSSHHGVGTEDVGHALHLITEQVSSCMNYYQL